MVEVNQYLKKKIINQMQKGYKTFVVFEFFCKKKSFFLLKALWTVERQ